MKYFFFLAASMLALNSYATSYYVPFVKPIEQLVIDDPGSGSVKRFEGCGPVAASMLFSYWESERDFKLMREAHIFNGSFHPSKTIKEFYSASWTKRAPVKSKAPDGKKYAQSFTLPGTLFKGLETFVAKANQVNTVRLKARRLMALSSNLKKIETLKSLLESKSPVISLVHNIPACLNSKDNKSGGWHYVILVGMNLADKTIDLLSGWKELDSSTSTGPEVHERRNHPDSDKAHIKCGFEEFLGSKPAFFWIEESAS